MFPLRFNFPFIKSDGSRTTIGDAISAGGGGSYTLPTASAETKGGVKIGSGLTMTGEVLSNNNPTPYSLPTASADTLGGVKVGSGLSIEDGVLSASGGSFSPTASTITVNDAMSTPTKNVLYKFANMVFMSFIASISAAGTVKYVTIGTLPEGYRPAESISIPCHVVSGSSTHLDAYMTIGTNGNINVVLPSDLYNSEQNYGFNKVMISTIFSI